MRPLRLPTSVLLKVGSRQQWEAIYSVSQSVHLGNHRGFVPTSPPGTPYQGPGEPLPPQGWVTKQTSVAGKPPTKGGGGPLGINTPQGVKSSGGPPGGPERPSSLMGVRPPPHPPTPGHTWHREPGGPVSPGSGHHTLVQKANQGFMRQCVTLNLTRQNAVPQICSNSISDKRNTGGYHPMGMMQSNRQVSKINTGFSNNCNDTDIMDNRVARFTRN